MMLQPKDTVRLQHMEQAIRYVEEFVGNKPESCLEDEPILRFAVERQLEIIGEAAGQLSEGFRSAYNSIEWQKIKAFRNFVSHEYFGIDLKIIWHIVQHELPHLKAFIVTVLEDQ